MSPGTPPPAPEPGPAPAFEPTLVQAARHGLCPRCGAPSLFAGWIAFAPRCPACGLDFSAYNVGDGPAAFLTLIIGTLVVILAVWLELAASPPPWVHVLLWVPLSIAGVMVGLRLAKAALLRSEYHQRAGQVGTRRRDPGQEGE